LIPRCPEPLPERQHRGTKSPTPRLTGPAQELDYRFKYFKPDGTNITVAVTGAGYEFTIRDKRKKFRLRVRLPAGSDPDGVCALLSVFDDMAAQKDESILVLNGGLC
jgi:hypothetical protein